MSTPSDIPHSPGRWLRLLLLDGNPGAITLLILATHHALNRVDAGADIAAHSRLASGPGLLPLHPHSSNGGAREHVTWAELRATQPQAWQEAIAADAALRHHPDRPPSGMPPGTTGYLHPARQPLAEVNLNAAPDAAGPACLPQACHGIPTGAGQLRGGR